MDERLARMAAGRQGLVMAGDCVAAGVSRATVRWAVASGSLVAVGRGAWVGVETWESADARSRHLLALRAALHRCPGAVATAESAAIVWDLPLPGPPPALPVLLRPRSTDRPERGGRSGGVLTRRAWLEGDEVARHRGVLVTTPARTFVDLCRGSSLPWSLAVADAARRRHGCTRDELLDAADRRPSAAGHARARRVAAVAESLVESPLESVARGVQLELGLPLPEVQVWIGRQRPEFRVDMLVRCFAVVVEADGRLKYDGPTARTGQAWQDKRRLDRLLTLGYDCQPFVAADSHRPRAWGRELLATFARSCRRLGRPPPRLDLPWA
ncbi:type IV toxin-antitoxin system AbiEi family antitoxin domain-containing protein [Aquipuribacter sp. MA13-6]|uniref:type IV toxin-antitoxin system AbiEi family antitoxin domain-containing protein n=1 Tax=unclassified Aquipuribacter TaxID=2635084 RepID=UPI003EEF71CD